MKNNTESEFDPSQEVLATLNKYYDYLTSSDWKGLKSIYHPEAKFKDEIFELKGRDQILAMWQMLMSRTQVKTIYAKVYEKNSTEGSGIWMPNYIFSGTKKEVTNVIVGQFKIQNGQIIEQKDNFNLRVWMQQAFKPYGNLLYYFPFFRSFFKHQARKKLKIWIEKYQKS